MSEQTRWTTIKTFDRDGVRVEVTTIPDTYRPPFSIRISPPDRNGWFQYNHDEEKIYAHTIGELCTEAEEWILDEMIKRDAVIKVEQEKMRERDVAMSAIQKAKKQKYEANREKRAEENRQRTARRS